MSGVIRQLLAQQAVEPQDRVHRCAQFMPDGGHKFVFVRLRRHQLRGSGLQFEVARLNNRQLRAVRVLKKRQHPHHHDAGQDVVEQGPQDRALRLHGLDQAALQCRQQQAHLNAQDEQHPDGGTPNAQEKQGGHRQNHQVHHDR